MPKSHSEAEFAEKKKEIDEQKEFHKLLKDMMYEVSNRRTYATAMAHICLSFLTAPLMTLSTSLQVSSPMSRVTLEHISSSQAAAAGGQKGRFAHMVGQDGAAPTNRIDRAQKFMQLNLKDKAETVR